MYASEKTRYKLAEAMKRLMESQPLEKITVTQITELCDTTRPTFYRYFKDKYDLINWYFDKLAQKSFKQMGVSLSLREALLKKFEFMTLEKKFFSEAFSCEEQNNLIDYDYEMIYQFYCDFIRKSAPVEFTPDIEFLLRMYCRGSICMTADWAKSGMRLPPERMADLLIDALPPRLSELFRDLSDTI